MLCWRPMKMKKWKNVCIVVTDCRVTPTPGSERTVHYSVRWAGRGDWKDNALVSQVSRKRWLKGQCIIQSGEPEEVIERTMHYSVRWAGRGDWKDNTLLSQVNQKRWLKGQCIIQSGEPEEVIERPIYFSARQARKRWHFQTSSSFTTWSGATACGAGLWALSSSCQHSSSFARAGSPRLSSLALPSMLAFWDFRWGTSTGVVVSVVPVSFSYCKCSYRIGPSDNMKSPGCLYMSKISHQLKNIAVDFYSVLTPPQISISKSVEISTALRVKLGDVTAV